jgi:hypothetical protein
MKINIINLGTPLNEVHHLTSLCLDRYGYQSSVLFNKNSQRYFMREETIMPRNSSRFADGTDYKRHIMLMPNHQWLISNAG